MNLLPAILTARMGYGWLKRNFIPHPIFDDERFKLHYETLRKSEWWSHDQLEAMQLTRLQALIKYAYENTPYYHRVFDENGLKPEDILALDDLKHLPLLTKEDVRNHTEELIARNVDPSQLEFATTGGSTGQPLGFYRNKHASSMFEKVFIHRQWSWAGYKRGDKFVTLREELLDENNQSEKRIWWDYNTVSNQLVLSILDMTEENMFRYVDLIKRFSPQFFNGHPSSLEILARFLKRNNIEINAKAVFCESETIYAFQREIIESEFNCKIFAGYGHAERAIDAIECECHEGYHNNMEYGIIELLDTNNLPIIQPGVLGRVVGTGLNTDYMPFIRYVTDDLAMYAGKECSCGRKSTLIQDFKGRVREMVVTKTGSKIPFLAVYGLTPALAKIREIKFLQEKEGELQVEIAKAPQYSEDEIEKVILDDLRQRLDETQMDFYIRFVDQVARTQRGKITFLDQKLPIRFEDFGQEEVTSRTKTGI